MDASLGLVEITNDQVARFAAPDIAVAHISPFDIELEWEGRLRFHQRHILRRILGRGRVGFDLDGKGVARREDQADRDDGKEVFHEGDNSWAARLLAGGPSVTPK